MKIAISGAHSSGKTTLGLEIVTRLKKEGKNVAIMPEVARDSPYLIANQQSPEAQIQIFASQIDVEMKYARTTDILVADRCILDHVMYMELFFPEQTGLIDAMKYFSREYVKTYDFIFRTSTLYNPKDTEDSLRPKRIDVQEKAHKNIKRFLDDFYPEYIKLPSNQNIDLVGLIIETIGF